MFLSALLIAWIWTLGLIALVMLAWRASESVARAPLLDVVMSLFTWLPWIYAAMRGGWEGFGGCLAGQALGLITFTILHSAARGHRGASTIRKTLDRIVGPVRNHLGLWVTVPALPIFLAIRAGEILLYPLLVRILGFPRYRHGDWVNISRQKFEGLVGHDLVWCLYCDWMTGVYSFGAEMLRNVESFWCPIKFHDVFKCDNCQQDFPDLNKWVKPEGTMKDVRLILEEYYLKEPDQIRSWFGSRQRQERPDSE